MEPEVEARFQRIEALLQAGAERGNQMEMRFNRRMDRAEQRMDRAEQRMDRAEKRMELAEQRMEKFDRRLEATRRVVETGMKLMVRLNATVNKLAESQKAMLNSMRTGGNGHAHGPGRR